MNSIDPYIADAVGVVMKRHKVSAVILAVKTGKSARTIRAFLKSGSSKTISKLEELTAGIGCDLSEVIKEAERIAEIEKGKR